MAPKDGDPITTLDEMYKQVPPCPECGGKISIPAGSLPGNMECAQCKAGFMLCPIKAPSGGTWPWQDGRFIPLDDDQPLGQTG